MSRKFTCPSPAALWSRNPSAAWVRKCAWKRLPSAGRPAWSAQVRWPWPNSSTSTRRMCEMTGFRLSLVAIGRIHFDLDQGMQFFARFRQQANLRGFSLASFPDAVTDLQSAQAAAEFLKGHQLDGLVIFQTTFADSQMITTLTRAIAL